MTKQQLAEALAHAINMVNELQAWNSDSLTQSQSNGVCELLAMLPSHVRDDFANNSTVAAGDLLRNQKVSSR